MSLFRTFAKSLPPIQRLLFERDALAARVDTAEAEARSLRDALARAQAETVRLVAHYDVPAREGRLIITDYAFEPRQRPRLPWLVERFDREREQYRSVLETVARQTDALRRIGISETSDTEPFWSNPWFAPLDGAMLYTLIADRNPRRYVEVGSGHSTRFARRAVSEASPTTEIVSIDPHPQSAVAGLADRQITSSLEHMPADFWQSLSADDLLFIDGSHRAFQNSDVTVFFTEVLPTLPSGLVYGIHDICLPEDYPPVWYDRFYNEQYLLACYLAGKAGGDRILLPGYWSFTQADLQAILQPLWEIMPGISTHGGAFWMRRA